MESGQALPRERKLSFRRACQAHMTQADKRNARIFTVWTFVWALSFVAATFLLVDEIVARAPLTWLVALVPTALGLQTVRSYVRFLRAADELLRKVHLEGLALGFGAGVIFVMGYGLLEHIGAPALDITDPILVFFFFWALGQWLAMRRYG